MIPLWNPVDGATGEARPWARRWLILAVAAVAVSGVFAILIALARVPALGTLFPGEGFYRVALVLHVNLSQGVWFMAFAGVLWSLHGRRGYDGMDCLALGLAAAGTAGIVLSVSAGSVRPLMSNYLPVLDSHLFLGSLAMFGSGVLLKALRASAALDRAQSGGMPAVARSLLLKLSAIEVVMVFVLLLVTMLTMSDSEGIAYFETLFWGPGHLWQFALLSLLIYCWLELAPRQAASLPTGILAGAILFSLVPVLLSLAIPLWHRPDSAASTYLYTALMRWTSWEAPLLVGAVLWLSGGRASQAPGFGLSLLLFVAGLVLGTLINGQTTLVTAHYHGTIGAITLAFMALSFVLLGSFGIERPAVGVVRLQLAFYGYGVLLMMIGLAGAGLMGAPRKTPGDLAASFSIETFSRICLGLGGLCATIGIVMFAYLLLRRLLPATKQAAYSL